MIPRVPRSVKGSRSQSALEYMMTYGWAILIIVIVAGVLYSLGIFSPSSSISTTITGFSGFAVQGACIQGGAIQMQITNGLGYTVNITAVNTTSSGGQSASIPVSVIIPADQSQSVFVPGACPSPTGSSFSDFIAVTYTEPGQTFSGPYVSNGKISGRSVDQTPGQVGRFSPPNGTVIASNDTSYMQLTTIPPQSGLIGENFTFTVVLWAKMPFRDQAQWMSDTFLGWSLIGTLGSYYQAALIDSSPLDMALHTCHYDAHSGNIYSVNSAFGNTWQFFAYTSKHPYYAFEMNNSYENESNSDTHSGGASPLIIGASFLCGDPGIIGEMADIQIYNISLSQTQLQALYAEGLGGAPTITNASLVAWWPLDGNTNDYSGHGLSLTNKGATFSSP